ncbi:peptide-methionine (R)-S-oxide reductase [Candidatus Peregrinibacteria bacterium CG11_big_fil_rev_8_21_14_0_20_46_8]|nr:MAG: peptide-methionine (R)-S-oxide reductase [Candidatus Peregrinibacteria bacterium CG11_big_fil_rev_8_21_14_0_20_46_8]
MTDDMRDKDDAYWREKLSPEQYRILREAGTEPPFSGKLYQNKESGSYRCGACNAELFSSDTKFDSGSGWPSFANPKNEENIELLEDTSHGMVRTEVRCRNCGSHLGHVFDDGPQDKGGMRYCINSCALQFESKQQGSVDAEDK